MSGATVNVRRATARAPWAIWGLTLACAAGGAILLALNRSVPSAAETFVLALLLIVGLGYATAGTLIAARIRTNAIGWILLAIGLLLVLGVSAEQYAIRGLFTAPGSVPWVPYVQWPGDWSPVLALELLSLVFLLFPTGRALSSRWRPVVWLGVGTVALGLVGYGVDTHGMTGISGQVGELGVALPNPFAIPAVAPALDWVLGILSFAVLVTFVLSLVSIALRYRRAQGDERQQVRALAYVAAASALLIVAILAAGLSRIGEDLIWAFIIPLFIAGLVIGVPVACALAILRYRLYDIDIVFKKSVVVGVIAVFITVVYVLVVVGIGALVGSSENAVLTFTAAAIVAVAFQPLRSWARRFADRMVYGRRATPYEVLSDFSERAGETISTEEVLPRMVRILAEATGARRAEVWLRVGQELRLEAAYPERIEEDPVGISGGELPRLPSADRTLPVRQQGELLGALTVTMPASEPLTPEGERLVADLASQAGLLLRNVRLTAELKANLEELRASRQRLVSAQDEERRRIERNIHDGAQQQLVALSVKLGLARRLNQDASGPVNELLEQIQADSQLALDDLRDLARGIYPPLLADQGLGSALTAQARKSPLPVSVESDGLGRYSQEVEAAVYFCVLEALQNVAKYAQASRATIRLAQTDGTLSFEISDDGVGFDPISRRHGTGLQGMADRLDAIGGSLLLDSRPGMGTNVVGRVPVRPGAES